MTIQYQENGDVLLAMFPPGRVEFLDARIKPVIDAANAGRIRAEALDWGQFVVNDPVFDLDGFHLRAPAIVFVEVTNGCNLRCKHCYVSSGPTRPNEMTTREVFGLLDDLADMGVLQIFLTGGEPFTRPDVVELITHARSKAFFTQVFTNGLLITEDHLRRIPAPTSFNISFDTADPVRTVRGGLDYPKLREVFALMHKHGHVLRTSLSVHRNNIEDTKQIFEWCAQHGYPRPQWAETHLLGRARSHTDILMLPNQVEQNVEVYRECMDLYFEAPEEPKKADGPQAMQERRPKPAIYTVDTVKFTVRLEQATRQEKCARSVAYVNASGDVFPCTNCQSGRMYRAGNIRETPLRDIWEHGFDEFRKITFSDYKDCATCPVNAAGIPCQFRCPPLSRNMTGDELGCAASDYMKAFMLRTHEYWKQREAEGLRFSMAHPRRPLRRPELLVEPAASAAPGP